MILIPARNEGPRVGNVVRRARIVCPDTPVVVVCNGCSDDTGRQAEAAGAQVIESAPGYARALQAGYRHALTHWPVDVRNRWLVQLDADGQHPPEAIPRMRNALAKADLVIGSRFASPAPSRAMGPARRWAIHGLGWWTTMLLGERLRDVTSGFQVLSGAVVAEFARDFPDEVADANVLVRARRNGFRIVEVDVAMAPRRGGQSMHQGWQGPRHVVRTAVLAAKERWAEPRDSLAAR